MEVILKKTKVTSSILKQTLIAKSIDLKTFEVLGFCVLKNQRWIVLYRSSTNELRKYLMIKEVCVETDHSDKPYWVKVKFEGNYTSLLYQTGNEEESQEFAKVVNNIKFQSQIKDQFFL